MKRFPALAFRNLWSRKLRTLLTGFGIVLGVATVLAFGVTNATVEKSLNDFFSQAAGEADLTILSAELKQTFRERAIDRAAAFPNTILAVGSLWREDAAWLRPENKVLTLVGIEPEIDGRVRNYDLAAGRMISRDDRAYTIVLVAVFAEDNDIQLGDDLEIYLGEAGVEKFEVVGLLESEGVARIENGSIGFLRLDVAQDLFAERGRVSQIDLVVSSDIDTDSRALTRFKDELATYMGDDYTVTYPAALGQAIVDSMAGLRTGLNIFSLVALFVGAMLIYNTFSMTIAERRIEIGMLRAIGTARRQILQLVLIEAVLLAFMGSILGLGFGLFMSIPLVQLFADTFAQVGLPLEQFDVPPRSMVQAVLLGIIATFVAAFVPAWQASRVSPVEAMHSQVENRQGFIIHHGWKIGLVMVALSLSELPFNILPDATFLFLIFAGATLVVPVTIQMLEWLIRRGLLRLYGPVGGLGSRNLNRAKGRTSLTIGVLMIGAALTIGVGAVRAAFGQAANKWINVAVGGDLVVTINQEQRAQFTSQLMVVPGVALVSPVRIVDVGLTGVTNRQGFSPKETSTGFQAVQLDTYRQVAGFQFAEEAEREEEILARLAQGGAVLASTVLSDKYDIETGDLIRLRTRHGERDFEVIGLINSFIFGGNSVVGIWEDMERYLGQNSIFESFMIKLSPGADADLVRQTVEARLQRYSSDFELESSVEFRETMLRQFNDFMTIFNVVVYIAILVAGLGVVNTMTMNVLERIREIGMLRSIGVTRWQVGKMVLAETAAMGVLGAAFGLSVGWLTSEDMVFNMSVGSGWQFDYVLPVAAFVGAAITTLIVSQLAALYPVWRASRVEIVEAIKHE
jgi:putative ABC transport system permease protein